MGLARGPQSTAACRGNILMTKQNYSSNTLLQNSDYRIAGIFRGYKFSRMDHYKGFRGFYFRGLSSSLLAHAHINMQLYLHTVSLESIILNTPTIINFRG